MKGAVFLIREPPNNKHILFKFSYLDYWKNTLIKDEKKLLEL